MEGNGKKYIRLLTELYNISEQAETKMLTNVEVYDSALKGYQWADVERQVSAYFAYKSDKSYPRIAQVVALLKADKSVKQMEQEEVIDIAEPSTNIVQIKPSFTAACRFLHEEGVLYVEYYDKVKHIPRKNGAVLKEIKRPDGRVEYRIHPRKWDIDDAIKTARQVYPDIFAPFERGKGLRYEEAFAFAVQLGVFNIKDS